MATLTENTTAPTFNLVEEVGGTERFRAMMTEFYDILFDDMIVGYMFQPFDKDQLIESQMAWTSSKLGDRSGNYTGPSIREAHRHLPIHPGMFDRRHQVLKELLVKWDIPEHVQAAWIALDSSLRDNIIRWGKDARFAINRVDEDS